MAGVKAAGVPHWRAVSSVSHIVSGIPKQRLVLRGGKNYGMWEEEEPMCDQYVTSKLIELEVKVIAYFLRLLVPLISLETSEVLGSAAQLFPFSICSFPDDEINRGSVSCPRPTAG